MKKTYRLVFVVAGMACLIFGNALAQDDGSGGFGGGFGAGNGSFGGGRGGFGGLGGGNLDLSQLPQQLQQLQQQAQQQSQQMRMNTYRTQLEIMDDTQWATIKEKIQKVLDAKQEPMINMRNSDLSGMVQTLMRGLNGGNQDMGRSGNVGAWTGSNGQRNIGNLGRADTPEEAALQKAIDEKASNTELKSAQAKVIEARKARQTKLEKAQDELRKALSPRQEAIAILNGLL
jgi:hypothetical protein